MAERASDVTVLSSVKLSGRHLWWGLVVLAVLQGILCAVTRSLIDIVNIEWWYGFDPGTLGQLIDFVVLVVLPSAACIAAYWFSEKTEGVSALGSFTLLVVGIILFVEGLYAVRMFRRISQRVAA